MPVEPTLLGFLYIGACVSVFMWALQLCLHLDNWVCTHAFDPCIWTLLYSSSSVARVL